MKVARRLALLAAGALLADAGCSRGEEASAGRARVAPDSLWSVPLGQVQDPLRRFELNYLAQRDRRDLGWLYEAYIDSIGANGIIDAVQRATPACYEEGHDLGRLILRRVGDLGRALRSCADACRSGCMHGAIMQHLSISDTAHGAAGVAGTAVAADTAQGGRPDLDRSLRMRIPSFCALPAMTAMFATGDCAHGVGHAAMVLADYDIRRAIGWCDLFEWHAMRYYCATGAYLEYRLARIPDDEPRKNPLAPCVGAPYPAACFRYVLTPAVTALYRAGGKLDQLARRCLALPQDDEVGCFHGIGNAHGAAIASGRIDVADVCRWGPRDNRVACIEGAMERLGEFRPEIAESRCDDLAGWMRNVCWAAVRRGMYDLGKDFRLYPR